jgi:hypothetical protein
MQSEVVVASLVELVIESCEEGVAGGEVKRFGEVGGDVIGDVGVEVRLDVVQFGHTKTLPDRGKVART